MVGQIGLAIAEENKRGWGRGLGKGKRENQCLEIFCGGWWERYEKGVMLDYIQFRQAYRRPCTCPPGLLQGAYS